MNYQVCTHPEGPVEVLAIDNEAGTFTRQLLHPGDDLTSQPIEVVAACTAFWTAELVGAWRATVAAASAPAPVDRWEVRKLLIIDRLVAAGRFGAAMAALGGPGSLLYERWAAAVAIGSDDAQVITLLTAIGADPAVILAAE